MVATYCISQTDPSPMHSTNGFDYKAFLFTSAIHNNFEKLKAILSVFCDVSTSTEVDFTIQHIFTNQHFLVLEFSAIQQV